jgi:predicted double-glycine peptidase
MDIAHFWESAAQRFSCFCVKSVHFSTKERKRKCVFRKKMFLTKKCRSHTFTLHSKYGGEEQNVLQKFSARRFILWDYRSAMGKERKIQHIEQPDNYSCGPTCIQMILTYYNIPHSRKQVLRLCDAKPITGTENEKMQECVDAMGMVSEVKINAQKEDIVTARNMGLFPIVNYFNPLSRCGHFSVITEINGNRIEMADPKNGAKYQLPLNEFLRLWHNHDGSLQRWMLISAPKESLQGL